MKTIILDTNFLMIPFQYKVDVMEEIKRVCNFPYKIAIMAQSLDELESLKSKGKGADKQAAGLALQFVKNEDIEQIESSLPGIVDDLIVAQSSADIVVATQDQQLKKRVKEQGASVLVLRQKKHLELIL